MYCKQCGKEIPEGARFCANCGIPVNKVSIKSTPERAASKHKTRFMLIIAACATVIFGIGIVLLLGRKKYDSIANQEDGQWLLSGYMVTAYDIYADEESVDYIVERWEYEYDSQDNMIKAVEYNEDGDTIVEYRYNSEGILVKETSYLYDLSSKSELEYDDKGNLTRAATYFLTGDLISISNYANDYEYDAQGNLSEAIFYLNDHFDHREKYQYDAEGKRLHYLEYRYSDAIAWRLTDYVYDDMGNCTENTYYNIEVFTMFDLSDDPDYFGSQTVYDSAGNITERYVYDHDGNPWSIYTCKYEYDASGNIIKEHMHEKDKYKEKDILREYGIVAALNTDMRWRTLPEETKGLFGWLTKWNEENEFGSSSGKTEMQYEYDESGKLIKATVVSISGDNYYVDGSVKTIEIKYLGKNIGKVTYRDEKGNKLYCEEYEYILVDTQ